MKRRTWISACVFLFLCIACFIFTYPRLKREHSPSVPSDVVQPFDPADFNGQRALQEVRDFIAIGPRPSGSQGARNAAQYLEKRLLDLGVETIIDEFNDLTPSGETTFRNVIGVISGKNEGVIILVSHYDTKSGISADFAGANDSGSSTGLLLEMARLLRQSAAMRQDIVIALLDGEECMKSYGRHDGLHGSRYFAKTLVRNERAENVLAVIVLDMVGDRNLMVSIPRNSSSKLTSLVFDSAREEGARLKFSLATTSILDDHVPFLHAGMPAIDLIDFEFGSAPGKNDYWHTDEDTLDKLSAESLEIVGRVLVRVLNKLTRTSRMNRQ